jgi:hypothetical protein
MAADYITSYEQELAIKEKMEKDAREKEEKTLPGSIGSPPTDSPLYSPLIPKASAKSSTQDNIGRKTKDPFRSRGDNHLIRRFGNIAPLPSKTDDLGRKVVTAFGSRVGLSRASSRRALSTTEFSSSSNDSMASMASISTVAEKGPRGTLLKNVRLATESTGSIYDIHIAVQRMQKKRANAVLKKGTLFRTEDDCIFLASYLKEFKAFLNLADSLMLQLVKIMTVTEYQAQFSGIPPTNTHSLFSR